MIDPQEDVLALQRDTRDVSPGSSQRREAQGQTNEVPLWHLQALHLDALEFGERSRREVLARAGAEPGVSAAKPLSPFEADPGHRGYGFSVVGN